jgi:hypothetical protein
MQEDGNTLTGADGKIILKWIILKKTFGGMNWIYLAQDRDKWPAFVNTVMNIWSACNDGNF